MPLKQRHVQPTSKGQVTLPVSIRRQLSITPNTLLTVSVHHGAIVLEPILREPANTEHWERVIDFTDLSPKGVAINEIQRALTPWTKSKKRSAN